MNDNNRLLRFLATAFAAVLLAMLTAESIRYLASPSLTPTAAWLLGILVAIVPAFVANRALTAAYRRTCDVEDAGELSSFFGTLAAVSVAVLVGLSLGMAGWRGAWAVERAVRSTGRMMGALPEVGRQALEGSYQTCDLRIPAVTSDAGESVTDGAVMDEADLEELEAARPVIDALRRRNRVPRSAAAPAATFGEGPSAGGRTVTGSGITCTNGSVFIVN